MSGRKKETGLLYYQLDTDIFEDKKVRRLLKNHGHKGFTVWIYLMTMIYKDKGYYLVWNDDECFDASEFLNVSESMINEVVGYCVTVGLFDKALLSDGGILTSKEIQFRWSTISKGAKRAICVPDPKHDLLGKVPVEMAIDSGNTQEEIELILEEIDTSQEEMTQSKVKYSKVNESKSIEKRAREKNESENGLISENKNQNQQTGEPKPEKPEKPENIGHEYFPNRIHSNDRKPFAEYFPTEKNWIETIPPAGAESWNQISIQGKKLLYAELAAYKRNLTKSDWILEGCKWYTRDVVSNGGRKFAIKNASSLNTQANGEGFAQKCEHILTEFNLIAGTSYNPKVTVWNENLIAIFNTGSNEQDIIEVIELKTKQWKGTDQAIYIRPETLFDLKKYLQYREEIKLIKQGKINVNGNNNIKQPGNISAFERINKSASEAIGSWAD